MEFYWELKYGSYDDLKSVMIPPAAVEVVKRRWDAGQAIHLSSGSIPANQIRSFEVTAKLFNQMSLIEDVARAFNEPMFDENGAMLCKWVKVNVTRNKYDKGLYANGYKRLDENNGIITLAFRKPVHEINPVETPVCNEDEVRQLTGSN